MLTLFPSVLKKFVLKNIVSRFFPLGTSTNMTVMDQKIISGFIFTENLLTSEFSPFNPNYLTHIYCGTLIPDPFGGLLFKKVEKTLKPSLYVPEDIRKLKYRNENLKILLSCEIDAKNFQKIKLSQIYFINEVYRAIAGCGYDGINIKLTDDLEQYKDNLVGFFSDLSNRLKKKKYLVTATVSNITLEDNEVIKNFVDCIDILNLVPWENPSDWRSTDFINPLYKYITKSPSKKSLELEEHESEEHEHEEPESKLPNRDIKSCVDIFANILSEYKNKISIGIPFSAWIFDINAAYLHKNKDPIHKTAKTKRCIRYAEIERGHSENNYKFDMQSKSSYYYNTVTQKWITTETSESLKHKCSFVRSNGLGGIVASDLFADDLAGKLKNSNKTRQYLLKTIYDNLVPASA